MNRSEKGKRVLPPAWAGRFLEWYCKPELLEDLQGDLNEYFHRHVKDVGETRARIIYVIDVFKFLRIYTIRKPEFINLLINWIMIGSYIKTSGRSIVRNKLFSAINIIGLAISMSVGLLMIAFISDMLSYDKFHDKGDRIYRVITTHVDADKRVMELASTSVLAGKKIQDGFTGVENSVMLYRGLQGDAEVGDRFISVEGMWATPSFFRIFSFPMVEGNFTTALQEPYSVVLTEKSAKKIFGNESALGKTFRFNTENDTSEYTVTGVMQEIPKFSHMQFDLLCSYTTLESQQKDSKEFLDWENVYMNYIYVLLPEGGDEDLLQSNLDKLCKGYNASLDHRSINLSLQHLYKIALGKDLSNPIGPTMMIMMVYILSGLAFVVIISACFNYTNLSIARSLRRSREVGIRKVIGALRKHVLGQFIVESVLISLFALVFAVLIFMFLRPQFLGLAPDFLKVVELDLSPKVILYFVIFAMVIGTLAGFLPAVFFSKINAVQVLKDASGLKVFRNVNMRKTLIVVQYCFSLIFITATIIGYRQYTYLLTFDLGFNTANVLNIELQGNKADLFEKELSEIKEIEIMSRSAMVTSVGSYWGGQLKYNNPLDSTIGWYNIVDERYLPLHGHKLVAGRNFTPKVGKADETEVMVNEQVLKRFNIANMDPMKAIGETIILDGKKLEIIAVLKDFHYGEAGKRIDPVIFRYSNDINRFINAKILSQDWPATLAAIESRWKKIDKVHALKATFYDDKIEEAFSQFSTMTKIIGFLSFLAICISSMGLLGMVVFTTETRLKEISIRKVLGASEASLIYILSRSFLVLLLVSTFVALPLTWVFFEEVIFTELVNHAPVSLLDMFISVVAVVAIAFVMIGSQTLKVARTNPAQVLKGE
jgi:putative ABC transport system permease protein